MCVVDCTKLHQICLICFTFDISAQILLFIFQKYIRCWSRVILSSLFYSVVFFSPRTTPSHTNLYDINQLNLLMFDLGFDFFTNVLFTNFNQFHHILLIILNPNVQVYVELFTFGAHFIGLYWIWFVYIPWFINTTTQRFALTHI